MSFTSAQTENCVIWNSIVYFSFPKYPEKLNMKMHFFYTVIYGWIGLFWGFTMSVIVHIKRGLETDAVIYIKIP